jgi:6-phosphogluconolactonase
MPDIRIFANLAQLSAAAADLFAQLVRQSTGQRFLVALSGGSTPRALFQLLAQPPYAGMLPWTKIHFFWGDERLVPPDDPGSSYAEARRLLFDHVPVPAANIHRIKGELPAEKARLDYVNKLRQFGPQGWPVFDLAIMGMGFDGHTASLFPGPIDPTTPTEPVINVTANYEERPAARISLTPLVFNDARHVLFLVTGENKAEAVTAVLHGPTDFAQWPAQRIQPHAGQLTWFLDQSAARLLPS